MMNWLVALLIVVAVTIPTLFLVHKHAPKWAIWATWSAWGALWLGVAGPTSYGRDPLLVAISASFGLIVGLSGGMVAAPPIVRAPRTPGRYQGGARRRWRRKYLH